MTIRWAVEEARGTFSFLGIKKAQLWTGNTDEPFGETSDLLPAPDGYKVVLTLFSREHVTDPRFAETGSFSECYYGLEHKASVYLLPSREGTFTEGE